MFNVYALFRRADLVAFVSSARRLTNGAELSAEDLYDGIIADKLWVTKQNIVIEGSIVAVTIPVRSACTKQERWPVLTVDDPFKPGITNLMIEAQCHQSLLPLEPGAKRKLGVYWERKAVGVLGWTHGEAGKCGYGFSASARPEQEQRIVYAPDFPSASGPNHEPPPEPNYDDNMQLVRDVVDVLYDVLEGIKSPYKSWFDAKR